MSDAADAATLPPEFSDLETYCPEWCPATERARATKRVSTDIATLRAFQARLAPRMDAVIAYLNTFPNDPIALPPPAQRLYRLAQMVMEASVPVDLEWDSSDIADVFPLERMTFGVGVQPTRGGGS